MAKKKEPTPEWLNRILALEVGQCCEVWDIDNKQWVSAIVEFNGGSYLWRVTVDGGERKLWGELVRCPGQTDAWPHLDGSPR